MPGLHTGRQGVEVMPELDPTDQGIDKTCEPEEQRLYRTRFPGHTFVLCRLA